MVLASRIYVSELIQRYRYVRYGGYVRCFGGYSFVPTVVIGQRAVEHTEWHSMVENSLKYDDLPMALVAGR